MKGALLNLAARPAASAVQIIESCGARGEIPVAASMAAMMTEMDRLSMALIDFQGAATPP